MNVIQYHVIKLHNAVRVTALAPQLQIAHHAPQLYSFHTEDPQEEVADAYSAQNDSHQILRSHGRLFPHTSCQQRHECVEKSPEQPDLNEANAVHEVAPVNLHQHDQKTEEDSVRAQNGVVQGKICGECVHIGGQGGHPHQAGGEMEQLEREQ
eukprot:CAMPEP_0173325334 /NCGR_PEP_ID=MMETSP1144-20121109/449_1 /TAXON_ID=483371 /ORGANISM="non described non described, Strain CCMP2298" /LENGTH=152 /DNA_ID=CAMNT_0014269515 /DNA_START=918 /DNA_END=1376 /DNA_ORIENTATION=-